ncbi:uncharacterized protein LOC9630244 [Selaginella moellendorffii]|uniref:uncharacterized protein LOC9630244 n=1 Tax=Selaginella moellendorffii TaxID=88036 RepID=UPI000D1C5A41|nr:uncharacterized protein LOC9630244 [Selaginella moellendorffii]|eukprot:XP_024517173.1 uncharacterized protein LOC9630244 [Selaginella moellendorffii]
MEGNVSDADYFEQMEAHLRFDLEMEVLDLESCLEAGGSIDRPTNAAPVQEEERRPLSLRQELAKARQIKSVSSRPRKQARRKSSVRILQPRSDRQRRSQRLVECERKGAGIPVACRERMDDGELEKDGGDENGDRVENPVPSIDALHKIVEKSMPDKEEIVLERSLLVDDGAKAERKRPSESIDDIDDRLCDKTSIEEEAGTSTSGASKEDLASLKLERKRSKGGKAAPVKTKQQRLGAMARPSDPHKVTEKSLAGNLDPQFNEQEVDRGVAEPDLAEKEGPKSNGSVDDDRVKNSEKPTSTPKSKESEELLHQQSRVPAGDNLLGNPEKRSEEEPSPGNEMASDCIEYSWEPSLPLEAVAVEDKCAEVVVAVVTENKTLAPIQQQKMPSLPLEAVAVKDKPSSRTDRRNVENARKREEQECKGDGVEDKGDRNLELLAAPVEEPKRLQPKRIARRRDRSHEETAEKQARGSSKMAETEPVKKSRKDLEAVSRVEETNLEAHRRMRTRSATRLQVSPLVIDLDEQGGNEAAAREGNQIAVIAIDPTGDGGSSRQECSKRINTRSSPQVAMLALEPLPLRRSKRASQEMANKRKLSGGEANRGTRIIRKRGVLVDDM